MSKAAAKFRVLTTDELFPEPLEALQASCDVRVGQARHTLSRTQLLRQARGCDGLITLLTDQIDGEVLDALPSVRIVSNVAVGFDNIDVVAATARNVLVTNTPGVLTDTTADLTFALMLGVSRRVVEADTFVRRKKWKRWEPRLLLGGDVHGKTLGIIGFGRIGQAVARRAAGFGMRVLVSSRTKPSDSALKRHRAEATSLKRLLAASDFVSVHVPLTPKTHHLIGGAELARMKPTATLINTARGPIVDEEALVTALRQGTIAGAGLDVFAQEPTVHKGLLELPNVVLMPHLGSATLETRTKMAQLAVDNLLAFTQGRKPKHCVNPQVRTSRRKET